MCSSPLIHAGTDGGKQRTNSGRLARISQRRLDKQAMQSWLKALLCVAAVYILLIAMWTLCQDVGKQKNVRGVSHVPCVTVLS